MRGHFAADLTGRKFGKLTVISRAPNQTDDNGKHPRVMWYCQCECGSPVKAIRAAHLLSGQIIGCGCVGYKNAKEAKYKHRQSKTRLYGVWQNMKNRCYNENVRSYKDYGARGIYVCDEWKNDFGAFSEWAYAHGYDPDAAYGACTIDRIDNDGPYSPDNCRFVNARVQANNRRRRVP